MTESVPAGDTAEETVRRTRVHAGIAGWAYGRRSAEMEFKAAGLLARAEAAEVKLAAVREFLDCDCDNIRRIRRILDGGL